jgi:DNA-binding HxlR family transcriptional regulator
MPRKQKRRSNCPINFALEIFGDTWSLLVIRDLMFMGKTTYGEFLQGAESISTNILADRLEKLEVSGIINKAANPANGTKFVYSLTERGKDLIPVMFEIIAWSGKHDPKTAATKELLERIATNRKAVIRKVREKLQSV